MKVPNDPTDGLPVDLDEAVRQNGMRSLHPVQSGSWESLGGEWADASQVLKMLQDRGSTLESINGSILHLAATDDDGRALLRTRARRSTFTPAKFTSKPIESYTNNIIEVWMWWGTLSSPDWGGGGFSIQTEDPYGTWVLQGVEFSMDDLKERGLAARGNAAVSTGIGATVEPDTGPSRGRKRKGGWNDFVAELALAAGDGKVTSTMTESQLLKLINDRLADRGIGEMARATVQEAIAAVLKRFRQDDADDG